MFKMLTQIIISESLVLMQRTILIPLAVKKECMKEAFGGRNFWWWLA